MEKKVEKIQKKIKNYQNVNKRFLMKLKNKKGMTILELLIVMTIIGSIYSIAIFSFKKQDINTPSFSLMTLKKNLSSIEKSGKKTLFCNIDSSECRISINNESKTSKIKLIHDGDITQYTFNIEGDLKPSGVSLNHIGNKINENSFEYTINSDGISSFLILKNKEDFYLYTPLMGEQPFVSKNEEEIKSKVYSESIFPVRRDDYYAAD
jgi:prepilin-type N-terminal cleavage/methylation domain-containing protein